jgi:hypothetical protein
VTTPDITIVIASFNRADLLRRAIDGLLAQEGCTVEVVVVDVSTDDTPKMLRELDDPRVKVVFADNLGMSTNRNVGLAHATGTWLAYLDDDDFVLPDWAPTLLGAAHDRAGFVLGGHVNVDVTKGTRRIELPGPGEITPSGFIAGSFIARREAIVEIGGMLEGLPMAHHWDLAVRLMAWCHEHDMEPVLVDRPVVEIETRSIGDRLQYSPTLVHDGKRWARARHANAVRDHPAVRVVNANNIAVPAYRLGRIDEARRWLTLAVRDQPRNPRSWLRLAVAMVPFVGRRVWGRELPRGDDVGPRRGLRAVPDLVAVRGVSPELLMLPFGYRERTDVDGTAEPGPAEREARASGWAEAARIADQPFEPQVVLVGDVDESGEPFAWIGRRGRHEARVGDAPPGSVLDGYSWTRTGIAEVGERTADLVVLPSVLERVVDPYALLVPLRAALRTNGAMVVSTPDRNVVDGRYHLGPPTQGRARRHRTGDQLVLLVEAIGLEVDRVRPAQPEVRPRRRGSDLVVTGVLPVRR